MRKMLLTVLMVGSGGGMLLIFCLVLLIQTMPPGLDSETVETGVFPIEVSETALWILQLTDYRGPFLEDPDSQETVHSAAILVENRGGLYISAGAVILQRQDDQLVFEVRDLPPGAKTLVLEKDAQTFEGIFRWKCCGWTREEYPEQAGWVCFEQLPQGLAVTNVADHTLPVLELTYKYCGGGNNTYVGGISFHYTLRELTPGETKILSLPHYGQDRIKVVKTIVYYEN